MGQINLVEINKAPNYLQNLFILFLVIAVCFILVRIARLTWRLFSLRKKQELSVFGNHDDEAIAKAALRGLIRRESIISQIPRVFSISVIDAKYLWLWDVCYSMIKSTRTLSVIIVILSFSVAALGCFDICSGLRYEETAGIAGIGAAGQEVFFVLAIGLIVSAFFYCFPLVFEGTLSRRLRDWNYLKSGIEAEFKSM
ncbi:MAG: hypothetical protein JXA73_03470 [Acidobacteria bacterium]|nr:hypothetical protein [Acidobacteriota bacterium]